MTTTPINDTSITNDFNIDELTEGTLTGKGVFDVLLQTLRLHLDREFTSGRITGTAYATVYSQAITSFLAQATQYAVSKAKLPLELDLLQAQIDLTRKQELEITQQTDNLVSQQGQIEAETLRIQYQTQYQLPEEVKVIKYNQDKLLAETDRITTDIAVAIKQGLLVDAQTCDVRAKTNQTNAEVKLKLPEEVELIKRNYAQVTAQTSILDYDLNNIKPVELSNLQLTGLGISADTANKEQVTANLVLEGDNVIKQGLLLDSQKISVDKQTLNTEVQTAKTQYEIDFVMPEEVKIAQFNQDQIKAQVTKASIDALVSYKQTKLLDAQVCEVETKTNQINTELALKLPEEVELLKRNQAQVSAQVDEIIYRSTTLLPSQTAQNTAQTAQITYTTSTVLPANVANVNAQKDSALAQTALYEQKTVTELAQTTTTPAAGSAMGMQNLLMERQADNYLRDAEQKAAKIMTETWQVRANADPFGTGNLPNTDNKLTNTDIGAVITKLKTGVGA